PCAPHHLFIEVTMLYVVECAYTDPQSEAAWNTFYNQEKLPALVSVPGFYASQRFRALSEGCPCYLALHDIHDATVIDRTNPVCRHPPTGQPASPGHDCRRLYLSAHHRPVTQPGAARVRSPCHLLPFIR
ncbi:hypothetical protein LAM23_20575, partial [Mycobacterium tuberculosis]|nr:hypothetical protein [Mycobacterium tuberculosis]